MSVVDVDLLTQAVRLVAVESRRSPSKSTFDRRSDSSNSQMSVSATNIASTSHFVIIFVIIIIIIIIIIIRRHR